MPRPLLDSVKNGRSFAASASRDRFAHCPSGRLRRWPSASRYFGFAYGEVSLAPLLGHRFATRYRSGDIRSVFRLRRASRPVWDIAPHSRGEAGFARVGGGAY